MATPEEQKDQEKIVNFCEDQKSHKHDDDSYARRLAEQEEAKKRMDNKKD